MDALTGLNSIHLILFICFVIFISLIISAIIPKKVTCNKCSRKMKINEFRYHYCEGIIQSILKIATEFPGSKKITYEFICPHCNDRRKYLIYIKSDLMLPSIITHFENCKNCKNKELNIRVI